MPKEIERKFLLKNNDWKKNASGIPIKQGYLSVEKERTVRVRIKGDKAFLTIKGITIKGVRPEYEYEIPLNEGRELLDICEGPLIEKTRYEVIFDNLLWEIDIFKGENSGLVLAEVELQNENQKINIPEWIAEEVTGNMSYSNSNLLKKPFSKW